MTAPAQPPRKTIAEMKDLTTRLHMTLCLYEEHPDYLVPYELLMTMLHFVSRQLRRRAAIENPDFYKRHRIH